MFFFFQAEDGIRDYDVTGVQTCALPICIYHDALKDDEQALACPTRAWKHSSPAWDEAFVEKQAHVIFCVRNPYSWAL